MTVGQLELTLQKIRDKQRPVALHLTGVPLMLINGMSEDRHKANAVRLYLEGEAESRLTLVPLEETVEGRLEPKPGKGRKRPA